jgi:hypothetical protein
MLFAVFDEPFSTVWSGEIVARPVTVLLRNISFQLCYLMNYQLLGQFLHVLAYSLV